MLGCKWSNSGDSRNAHRNHGGNSSGGSVKGSKITLLLQQLTAVKQVALGVIVYSFKTILRY